MTTPSNEPAPASGERRLHPLSWVFDLTTHIRGLVLPGMALLVTSRWTNLDVFLLPAAVLVLASALIRQWSLRYAITDTELIVRRNLLVHRSERHIPLARVHNLKTSATPVHRWMGVVEVAVETASGAEPEATLRVLSDEALAELRARVAANTAQAGSTAHDAGAAAGAPPIFEMTPRALLLTGLLNNRGLIIAGALAGVAWEITTSLDGGLPWDPRTWKGSYELVRSQGRDLLGVAGGQSWLTLVGLALAAFALLKALSIAWALIWLYGFRVTRSATSLVVERGLVPRTSTVIPFARIQQVVVREPPLFRLAGVAEVELMIVGGAAEDAKKEPVWLAPLVPVDRLAPLLAEIGVDGYGADAPWRALHPRAGRRMRTRTLLFLAPVSVLAGSIAGWRVAGVAPALLLPVFLWVATRQAGAIRYAVTAAHVLVRRGWLRRSLHLTWIDRVQVVVLSASPFDRRHGMASVLVDTSAGTALGAGLDIPFLGDEVARGLARKLAAAAATTGFEA